MEQTDPRQLLINIVKILEKLKIPYFVTGGMAVLIWGRPRFTADIDIIIVLKSDDIDKLEKALLAFSKAGYVDKEAIQDAFFRHGEFNFIDGNTGIKVDFWISKNDQFDSSRLKRKTAKNVLGEKIYFSSPEDLILIKLLWYKESPLSRQLEDVESILKISGGKLDKKYLEQWASKLGVLEVLKKIK